METARLFRAAQYMRLSRFEISGTNIGTFLNSFEQVALLLEYSRRAPRQPIIFFGLSSTGLDEFHFRCIIKAVQNRPHLPNPTGRPDVNDTCSEMELQIQIASARKLYLPLHEGLLITSTLWWQMSIAPETLADLEDACDSKAVHLTITPQKWLCLAPHSYSPY